MSNKKSSRGSTLIEVLAAILVVGLVITGVMLSITYSVKNSAEARYREVASQLAQDGMEVVKLRREVDVWSTFFNYAPSSGSRKYCLASSYAQLNVLAATGNNNCVGNLQNGNKVFTRFVELSRTNGDPQTVIAKITVGWQSDSNQPMNVEITQEFKDRVI